MMLRRLRGPLGRHLLALVLLAGVWVAWAYWPPRPVERWDTCVPPISAMAVLPGGTRLIALEGPQPQAVVLRPNGEVAQGDPSLLAPGVALHAWDAANGREVVAARARAGPRPRFLSSADSSRLAIPDVAGGITVWSASDRRSLFTIPATGEAGRHKRVYALASGGRTLACDSGAGTAVELWDVERGERSVTLDGAAAPLAFAADGRTLATGVANVVGQVHLCDVASGQRLGQLDAANPLLAIGFSPDGRSVAGVWRGQGEYPAAVTVWDRATLQVRATLPGSCRASTPDDPLRLDFSPEGRFLVVRGSGTGLFWDLARDPPMKLDGLLVATGGFDGPAVNATDYPLFNATGTRFIIPGYERGSWFVFDAATVTAKAYCSQEGTGSGRPVLSPDGRRLAIASFVGPDPLAATGNRVRLIVGKSTEYAAPRSVVQVWDLESGQEESQFLSGTHAVGFSPDSQSIWTWSQGADLGTGPPRLEVEQWAIPTGWPPTWLIAVTSVGLVLIAWDWRRRMSPQSI